MAITPTGAIFKTLNFDGESLRSYGVYISGEATFNAPAREVEMISIPGRSGQLALDKGRFENIEVVYPAGIYADTEADFAEAVSELRNFLCSRSGYCRIEDDYNPNEFRMGIYKSGLDVTPAMLKAGEFDLVFDCKPQRWLKSGEDEIEVQDGDTITNPTLFDSSPMLEIEGYGTIGFNGNEIEIEDVQLGDVVVAPGYTTTSQAPAHIWTSIDGSQLEPGDVITINKLTVTNTYIKNSAASNIEDLEEIEAPSGLTVTTAEIKSNSTAEISYYMSYLTFEYGNPASINGSVKYRMQVNYPDESGVGFNISITTQVNYDGNDRIDIYITGAAVSSQAATYRVASFTDIIGSSTQSILGHPTFIDCDLGEAYKVESGSVVSLNRYIDLGSDLPTLASGANTFEIDNTITDLKVIPRWWKV